MSSGIVDASAEGRRQPVLVLAVCRLAGCAASSRSARPAHGCSPTPTRSVDRTRPAAHADERRAARPRSLSALARPGSRGRWRCSRWARRPVSVSSPTASRSGRAETPVAAVALGEAGEHGRATPRGVTEPGRAAAGSRTLPPRSMHRARPRPRPLDRARPGGRAWLETLLRPGQTDRVELLGRRLEVARTRSCSTSSAGRRGRRARRARRPTRRAGLHARWSSTVGTLVYLPGARRQAFVDEVTATRGAVDPLRADRLAVGRAGDRAGSGVGRRRRRGRLRDAGARRGARSRSATRTARGCELATCRRRAGAATRRL